MSLDILSASKCNELATPHLETILCVITDCLWECLHAMGCASYCNTSPPCLSFPFCFIYLKDKFLGAEIAFHSKYVQCPARVSSCLVEFLVVIVVFSVVFNAFCVSFMMVFEVYRMTLCS